MLNQDLLYIARCLRRMELLRKGDIKAYMRLAKKDNAFEEEESLKDYSRKRWINDDYN